MRNLFVSMLFLCCAAPVMRAADAPAFPVAVLNMEEVFNTAKVFAERKAVIQQLGGEAQKELEKLAAQEKELKGKLGMLAPSNPEQANTAEALEVLKVRQKIYLDRTRNTLEKAQVDLLASAAAEVRTALKTYSEENGWKVVLLASDGPVGRGGLQETQLQLGMQTVLYTANGHDITASFIAWLNARNAAAAAAPAGP